MRYGFALFLATLILPIFTPAQAEPNASTKVKPSAPTVSASSKPSVPSGQFTRVAAQPGYRTIRMRATGYSWRERAHRRTYGRQNCMGGLLTELVEGCQQCAADTDIFPLGTILEVPGAGRRIVTDRGSAVYGGHHIDLHFNTISEMLAWGTHIVQVRVIRRGWGK